MTYPFVTIWEQRPTDDGYQFGHIASVQSDGDLYFKPLLDAIIRRAPPNVTIVAVRGEVIGAWLGKDRQPPADLPHTLMDDRRRESRDSK